MNSPFKFLDSYTKEDKNIYFGRDAETEEIYSKVFESKMLIVYGISGTGKTSLINCGLANKFNDADWLPINIRRQENLNASWLRAIEKLALTPLKKTAKIHKQIQSVYLDHFKPLYFIFDQFEELFVFGTQEERETFIDSVKNVVEADLQCRFLFVIREEYLAAMTEFEWQIPTLLRNRMRIERITKHNAIEIIENPCKAFGINIEAGFAQNLLDKLSPSSSIIELTYLQVFLDKVFHEEIKHTETPNFTVSLLDNIGSVTDVLGSFLDTQIALMPNPETATTVLKAFVSERGTRKPVTETDIENYAQSTGKNINPTEINSILLKFISLRIVRDKGENNVYELRHDSLAAKIFEKITLIEREIIEIRQFIEHSYSAFMKRGVYLSVADISYIAPYENKLMVSAGEKEFIARSKNQWLKVKRRRRNIAATILLSIFIIMGIFSFWALRERTKAVESEAKAKVALEQANIEKEKAETALNNFIEAEKKRKQAEVNRLLQKARGLIPLAEFNLAIKTLEEALEIDSTNTEVKEELKNIKNR